MYCVSLHVYGVHSSTNAPLRMLCGLTVCPYIVDIFPLGQLWVLRR